MSLFGSLNIGASALRSAQSALAVTGNNIANVNTPGFIRQEVGLSPIRNDRFSLGSIGDGVTVGGVLQKVDRFLAERAREARGDFEGANTRANFLQRVEGVFNELTDNDLSTGFQQFFNSIQDVVNTPDDPSLRAVVVARGDQIADTVRSVRSRIGEIRDDISAQVRISADEINNLLVEIDDLNSSIVAAEAGTVSVDAGSLRSLRDQKLTKLNEKIDIQVFEEPEGSVNIFTDGVFLVMSGAINEVATRQTTDRGSVIDTLVFAESRAPLPNSAGRIGGAQTARDQDIGGVIDALDQLTGTLIFEFNKIHSSGQGLRRFTSVESENFVLNSAAPLDTSPNNPALPPGTLNANLPFTPVNGAFELRITDANTGLDSTRVIEVDLDGIGADDSLDDIVARLDAAFGAPVASVTVHGKLRIQAPTGIEFGFADDTSGFLAAMGINTFFSGRDSRDIRVSDDVRNDPTLFAASANGAPGNTENALALAQFQDQSFASLGDESFLDFSLGLPDDLAALGQSTRSEAEFLLTTKQSLEAENLSITGVDLDEEAIKLIEFQTGFQAAARYIQTINELLDVVINLGN